jgi:hypothetical protein
MGYLRAALQTLDHLLNGTSAMHVLRDADKVVRHTFDQQQTLLLLAVLQQLLAQIVAERICWFEWLVVTTRRWHAACGLTGHQLGKVRVHLVEDDVYGLGVHLVELLLQETAAVLVLAHRIDLADHLVDARVTSSCENERFSMKPCFKSDKGDCAYLGCWCR